MTLLLFLVAALLAGDSPAAKPAAPATPAPAPAKPAPAKSHPRVVLETTKGKIVLELDPDKAPKSVDNFLAYVKAGQYDGTIFHRVIDGFMVQGGGMTTELRPKPTRAPIPNEADNGLKNVRGTVAMARTADPDSATAQFFVNTVDNAFLDFKEKSQRGWGYTVFAKVVEGMDVVDAISKVKVATKSGYENVPIEPVVIQKATVK